MPNPTHPWRQVHKDERESKFAVQLTQQWHKDHRHEQKYSFRMNEGHVERGHIAVSNLDPLQAMSLCTHARDVEEVSIPLEHDWLERAPSYVPHVVLKKC